MKIQLLSLVSAAVALSLPEIPALPDLVEIVENSFHGNFTAQTVEEPKAFLPTIAEIRAMTDQERAERFHWFLCVFLLVFLCVVISGTVIMVVGAWLKACGSYQALDRTAALSRMAQLGLVMLSLGGTVSLSLAATLWSMASGTLSKTFGLDWEIYLVLFCCAGASLLVQAVLAVTWLKAGDSFDWTAFAVASFSSMAPVISDQCDTLKDIIFGGFCLQSQNFFMKMVGVLSWSYLLAFHAWFIFLEAVNESDALGANCFNELATSHLSVLLIAPKVQGEWSEWSGGCCQGIKMTILPTIYRQVTKSKLHHLLIENVPQALMSFLFLAIEGGSVFVAVLNLVIPGVQIALTFLLFKPVRSAAIPALGKKLSRAMKSGNIVAAKALWEEAGSINNMMLAVDNLMLGGSVVSRPFFALLQNGSTADCAKTAAPTDVNLGVSWMVGRDSAGARCQNLVAEPMEAPKTTLLCLCRTLLTVFITLLLAVAGLELMTMEDPMQVTVTTTTSSLVMTRTQVSGDDDDSEAHGLVSTDEPNARVATNFQLTLTLDGTVNSNDEISVSLANQTGFFAAYNYDTHVRDGRSPSLDRMRSRALTFADDALQSCGSEDSQLVAGRRLQDDASAGFDHTDGDQFSGHSHGTILDRMRRWCTCLLSWSVERNHVDSLRAWISDLVLWASASDLDPMRHGPIAALQVQGAAKELIRELTPQQLQHGDIDQATGQQLTGLMFLVTVVARRYAPLEAESTTKSIAEFLAFRRQPGETIDSLLVRSDILRNRAHARPGFASNMTGLTWLLLQSLGVSTVAWDRLLAPIGGQMPQNEDFGGLLERIRRLFHLKEGRMQHGAAQGAMGDPGNFHTTEGFFPTFVPDGPHATAYATGGPNAPDPWATAHAAAASRNAEQPMSSVHFFGAELENLRSVSQAASVVSSSFSRKRATVDEPEPVPMLMSEVHPNQAVPAAAAAMHASDAPARVASEAAPAAAPDRLASEASARVASDSAPAPAYGMNAFQAVVSGSCESCVHSAR
eukprot:s677_g23.t1